MDDKEDAAAKKTVELREKYRQFIEDVLKNTTEKQQPNPNREKILRLRNILFNEKRYLTLSLPVSVWRTKYFCFFFQNNLNQIKNQSRHFYRRFLSSLHSVLSTLHSDISAACFHFHFFFHFTINTIKCESEYW